MEIGRKSLFSYCEERKYRDLMPCRHGTSLLVLQAFSLVNFFLFFLKQREEKIRENIFCYHFLRAGLFGAKYGRRKGGKFSLAENWAELLLRVGGSCGRLCGWPLFGGEAYQRLVVVLRGSYGKTLTFTLVSKTLKKVKILQQSFLLRFLFNRFML